MGVFVAGATGAIGQYLVPTLVAAGHWTPRYPSWRDGFPVWTKEARASAA